MIRSLLDHYSPNPDPQYTSVIRPSATIINEIQPGDTTIYVDNAYPVFTDLDNLNENVRDILIIEDKETESAVATANVSTSSTSPPLEYPVVELVMQIL